MKPDYKNWIPKGMLVSLIAGTVLSLALLLVFGVFGIGVGGKLRIVLGVVFGIAFVVASALSYAIYIVGVNQPLLKQVATLTLTFYALVVGLCLFLVPCWNKR